MVGSNTGDDFPPLSPTFSHFTTFATLLWLLMPAHDKHKPPSPCPHRRPFQSPSSLLHDNPHLTHLPDPTLPPALTKKSQARQMSIQSDRILTTLKKEKFLRPTNPHTCPRHPYHLLKLLPPHTLHMMKAPSMSWPHQQRVPLHRYIIPT